MNEYEVFAKAFRCSPSMAESIVKRIRERVGREVPMSEMLNAIKKIPPTRLSTDSLVLRLQKNSGTVKPARKVNDDDVDDGFEPEELEEGEEAPARKAPAASRTRTTANKRPTGLSAQVDECAAKELDAGPRPGHESAQYFGGSIRAADAIEGGRAEARRGPRLIGRAEAQQERCFDYAQPGGR